jgi:hypothetical protein
MLGTLRRSERPYVRAGVSIRVQPGSRFTVADHVVSVSILRYQSAADRPAAFITGIVKSA